MMAPQGSFLSLRSQQPLVSPYLEVASCFLREQEVELKALYVAVRK
jgi:hypothetical protein